METQLISLPVVALAEAAALVFSDSFHRCERIALGYFAEKQLGIIEHVL
jgi:hypothetical protein